MSARPNYDCSVIGGGLAGLALSIQLASAGFKVILFEKEKYPFHRVCGEYVSLESLEFLEGLGLPLTRWRLPVMKRLMISASGGDSAVYPLPLGGLGISRYKLDAALAQAARQSGVELLEQTKVNEVTFDGSLFYIQTAAGAFEAPVCCGTFGKRSNLDVRWGREFIKHKGSGLNNFIAVKYHALLDHPRDMIALHNFHEGYCGVSAIEDNKYCICYLTIADNLRASGNDIRVMERNILSKNPRLQTLFSTARFLYDTPLTISRISFDRKQQIEDHILMAGDAAGMITPICGNGMSMALHGSKIAASVVSGFLQGKMSRPEMERQYQGQWLGTFHNRLRSGRVIQKFFGREILANMFIRAVRPFPALVSRIIRQTHGNSFPAR